MLTLSITSERKTTLRSPFLMGAVKLGKRINNVAKKTQSIQRKNEKVNATSSRDIRTCFEKRGTISSTKTSTPENVLELRDDE